MTTSNAADAATTSKPDEGVRARRRDGSTLGVTALLGGLDGRIAGDVVTAGHPDYHEARRVWNGMVDRRPAAVVRCADADDVAATVQFAREHDLVLTVRGGGHNAAGVAVADGAIVIDLAGLDDVDVVVDDSGARARAGGGVTIGRLDAATQRHGLAVPLGVVTETGVAGLTLGGGYGWLRRRFGLSCDNLVSAEVVLADGSIVHASEHENPDLLWGLRGGGGNYGIVTLFEYRAHRVGPEVFFAVVMHAGSDAVEALRFFRAWAAAAPDEVSALGVLWHAPAIEEIPAEHHGTPIVTFVAMHCGTADEGEAELAPLRDWGTPIADLSAAQPYLEVQRFFDEDYPKWVRRYYWTSAYVTGLPDALVDRLVALCAAAPSEHSTIDVWQGGGAPSRVPADATALGDRSAAFMLGIEANWDDPSGDRVNIDWAHEVVAQSAPWATGARYANFPGHYEESEGSDFFGGNARRAAELKATYDPDNVFDRNHNVAPRAAAGR